MTEAPPDLGRKPLFLLHSTQWEFGLKNLGFALNSIRGLSNVGFPMLDGKLDLIEFVKIALSAVLEAGAAAVLVLHYITLMELLSAQFARYYCILALELDFKESRRFLQRELSSTLSCQS